MSAHSAVEESVEEAIGFFEEAAGTLAQRAGQRIPESGLDNSVLRRGPAHVRVSPIFQKCG
jgi:hypothetical protein